MENENSEKGFLNHLKPEDYSTFAEVDFLLKSGKHIQKIENNHFFDFIQAYEPDLKEFYKNIYRVRLESRISQIDNETYYFLDIEKDENNIGFAKTKNRKRFENKYALLGILLLYLYRVEQIFSPEIKKEELIETLKNDDRYKNKVYLLFGKTTKQESTAISENTIDSWVENALSEFEELGLVNISKDRSAFQILPAIDRLAVMYQNEIQNIDRLVAELQPENETDI